jgi:uncharacterized protein
MDINSAGVSFYAFANFLTERWNGRRPLAKLLRSQASQYLYDTGTNKLLQLGEIEFNILEQLFAVPIQTALNSVGEMYPEDGVAQAIQNIQAGIQKAKLLSCFEVSSFDLSNSKDKLDELVGNHLGMMQLEVTDRCNLRCAYCVYGSRFPFKRNHGTSDMRIDIACRAIDDLIEHSRKNHRLSLTFYGGEPLLRFPLIKSCVAHILERAAGKKDVGFSITTNVTLVSLPVAEYFARHGFSVVASIDGPEEIHDRNRRTIGGDCTFRTAIKGLKRLFDAYGQASDKIGLSMVYAPPFSIEKLDQMSSLWEQVEWLPRSTRVNISYALSISEEQILKPFRPELIDTSLFDWASYRFLETYQRGDSASMMVRGVVEKGLAQLYKRPVYETPSAKFYLNGCCVPGVRKIFVSVSGQYYPCERILDSPPIGNVANGIDRDLINNI